MIQAIHSFSKDFQNIIHCNWVRILFLFVIPINFISAQTRIELDELQPVSNPTAFGVKLTIPKITVFEYTESDDSDKFPVGEHTLRLTAPSGFSISGITASRLGGKNIQYEPSIPDLTIPQDVVDLDFEVSGVDLLDEIYLEKIYLTPDTYSASTTYSGKLLVELILEGNTTITTTKTFPSGEDDYYVMEVPVLNITYDDVGCDGLPYTVSCEITNAVKTLATITSGDPDTLRFINRYYGSGGGSDYSDEVKISSPDGAGGSYEFTIASFDNDHDRIEVKYFAGGGWNITEYLYIDGYTGAEDIDITIETPPEITFVDDESSVSVTIYEADVPLSKYINDAGNCRFLIDSDDAQYFYEDTDGEYYFMAG